MDGVIENTSTDKIIMIDKLCKRILGHPEVLGRIIKGFIKEAENLSLEEIMELIKVKKDHEGNYYFQQLNNVSDIPHHRKVEFDYFCCINLPQKEGTTKRIYSDMEIQNVENPGYALLTRGNDYLSRMITSQNGKEYDYRNYDGMKKVYSLWIIPKAPKIKDGHMNVYETNERIICGTTIEEKEVYDKGVILVIYLNKEHDLNKKYEVYDELLTPLMVLLNNVLDYKGKQRIIEEYGLNTKKIESEVKDMCDLGESIALEARNEGKQIERKEKNIAHVKN